MIGATETSLVSIILAAAGLLLASILASRASSRVGVPALLFFLALGMLAGSDGPGGIVFDNAPLAQALGIVSLAFILFSGGLDTKWSDVRPVAGPAIGLATLGVLITAALTGWLAWLLLGVSPLEGLLLGAIVSSTDAAAVFSVLRARSIHLPGRLKSLLELESGSNDPMAVFLTIGLIGLLQDTEDTPITLAISFFQQMAVGGVAGYLFGRTAPMAVNRARLEFEGLYPALTVGLVLCAYGLTDLLGGSGFLAVYIAGIVMRRADFVHKRSLIRFHDALAWMMQIAMFLTLGLQVFPARLGAVAVAGAGISLFVMFVARPVAVFATLALSRYPAREQALVAWVGLRGAAPIILATFPLVAGLRLAEPFFHLVFFIVLTSTLLQGTSIPLVVRLLRLTTPAAASATDPLELVVTGDRQLLEIRVPAGADIVGRRLMELGLPAGTLLLVVARNQKAFVPSGTTVIFEGDQLVVLTERAASGAVRALFETVIEAERAVGS